jgi:hypothetical protein
MADTDRARQGLHMLLDAALDANPAAEETIEAALQAIQAAGTITRHLRGAGGGFGRPPGRREGTDAARPDH